MASINTFDEMGLNKKREYEAKLKREGIVAEGTVSAGNMEEEEGWVERFRKIPMVKLLRESKCVANDSREQDLADIMTEINKHEWDKIEDFIQSELDRARKETFTKEEWDLILYAVSGSANKDTGAYDEMCDKFDNEYGEPKNETVEAFDKLLDKVEQLRLSKLTTK